LTKSLKEAARNEGFDEVGVVAATPDLGAARLEQWLADGRHGDMAYMADHFSARRDPNLVLAGVKSVVVAALNYRADEPAFPNAGEARISRYAWGRDYHDVIRGKLRRVIERVGPLAPAERFRPVVDSAPLMERDYARMAGLGWFGKNTLLLNRRLGSFFFLGAILTTMELVADAPFEADHCGACTKCLEACPTQAFDDARQLDPRRCISYLTIEHRGAIDERLRGQMGDWIFGCDVCQDVCPWNSKSPATDIADFRPPADVNPLSLETILAMDDASFRARFRGTPLFRAKRRRLVRNALIAAVNGRCFHLKGRIEALCNDPEALVSQTARWALQQLRG